VSYGFLPEDRSRWWIPLLVIDSTEQRRGHGRAALRALIDDVLRRAPDAVALGLSSGWRTSASEAYLELGFVPEVELDSKGEVVAWLPLTPRGDAP
jgi:GNAT superfamily N-acetyltransferase